MSNGRAYSQNTRTNPSFTPNGDTPQRRKIVVPIPSWVISDITGSNEILQFNKMLLIKTQLCTIEIQYNRIAEI